MSILRHSIQHLRQLAFPPEFRIHALPPEPPPTAAEAAAAPLAEASERDHELVRLQREEERQLKLLADLATSLWRLRGRMLEPETGLPKDAFRREYRHVEAMWDALAQAGMEVQDHTGAPYDVGMSLKVLTFQPAPGVPRERVQETLKPSLYWQGRSIQMGEVIVETPEKPPETAPPQDATPEATPPEKQA